MTLTKVFHPEKGNFKLTSDYVYIASLFALGIATLLHFALDFEFSGFLAFMAFLFVPTSIVTTIWGWNEYYPKHYIAQGSIKLSIADIIIDDQNYALEDVDSLIFDINDFKGKRMRHPYMLPAGPCLAQGDNNFIRFNHNGIDIEVRFLLRSKEELIILGEFLTQLYVNRVAFTETLNGGKSHGLENLNYKEIQEYKKKQLT